MMMGPEGRPISTLMVADCAHMRYEFIKGLGMSLEELRRDPKEGEDDPLNRSRMASIVNDSRQLAVALQYLGEKDLPRVIAKGQDELAAQMRDVAAAASVAQEFEATLAQLIYDEVAEDQAIPPALFEPVADALKRAKSGGPQASGAMH